MNTTAQRGWLGLCLVAGACTNTGSENLPDGGFTTGNDTTPTTGVTATTTTTTTTTTGPTTTAGSSSSTTTATSDGTETTTSDASTSESSTSTTDPSTSSTTSETTGPPGCDAALCFEDPVTYALGGMGPADVVAGDFDGDADMDVATANPDSDDVSVLLGGGDGTLGAATEYGVGTGPVRIVADELSGDTRDDIVTANPDSNDVSVLLASDSGFDTADTYAVGTTPVDLGLADIAGGGLDIGVANSGSDNVNVLTNDGAGAFTVGGPFATVVATNVITPSAVAMGEIGENAAYDDIWYGGLNRYGASPGTAGGGINAAVAVGGVVGTALARAEARDVTGNGYVDVVAIDAAGVVFFRNSGLADAAYNNTALTVGTTPSDVTFADMNDDNMIDIVASNAGSDDVSILLSTGVGTFGSAVSFECGTGPSGVAVADLDEDGYGDVICSNPGADQVTVLLSVP